MRVFNVFNPASGQTAPARQAAPANRLVSMLNEKAEGQSPLESARRALLEAKSRLEQQRDERIEQALPGYRALRARQTSYENALDVQQKRLEQFQALNDRRDALSGALSSAKAEYDAYAAAETTLDITQHNRLSLRVSSLEQELASVDQDISALVDQANRYAKAQSQYADYLEKTGQEGYAAFQYRGAVEYTRENFASETAGLRDRMEAGTLQWREQVSSYCGEWGLTPYDMECYLQERQKLGDACFAAQQRYLELLQAAQAPEAAVSEDSRPADAGPSSAGKASVDTVEMSGSALAYMRRMQR